jgi:GntR family transcriptional regulator
VGSSIGVRGGTVVPEQGIDRDSGTPLYAQVRDVLRSQILGQNIAPGEHLPGELELQDQFGVSRSVIRQALAELADSGLIQRHQGRGSVVVPARVHHRQAEQAGGLNRQLAAAGEHLRTVVLDLVPMTAPDTVAPAIGTLDAWRIERLRFVDDEPLAFVRSWVSRELFPDLTADAIQVSLHDYMRSTGIAPVGGPRQLRAVPADPIVSGHLKVEVGTPILVMQAVTNDARGRGLEWSTVWHPPSTVFDINAKVEVPDSPLPDLPRVRDLVAELATLLSPATDT